MVSTGAVSAAPPPPENNKRKRKAPARVTTRRSRAGSTPTPTPPPPPSLSPISQLDICKWYPDDPILKATFAIQQGAVAHTHALGYVLWNWGHFVVNCIAESCSLEQLFFDLKKYTGNIFNDAASDDNQQQVAIDLSKKMKTSHSRTGASVETPAVVNALQFADAVLIKPISPIDAYCSYIMARIGSVRLSQAIAVRPISPTHYPPVHFKSSARHIGIRAVLMGYELMAHAHYFTQSRQSQDYIERYNKFIRAQIMPQNTSVEWLNTFNTFVPSEVDLPTSSSASDQLDMETSFIYKIPTHSTLIECMWRKYISRAPNVVLEMENPAKFIDKMTPLEVKVLNVLIPAFKSTLSTTTGTIVVLTAEDIRHNMLLWQCPPDVLSRCIADIDDETLTVHVNLWLQGVFLMRLGNLLTCIAHHQGVRAQVAVHFNGFLVPALIKTLWTDRSLQNLVKLCKTNYMLLCSIARKHEIIITSIVTPDQQQTTPIGLIYKQMFLLGQQLGKLGYHIARTLVQPLLTEADLQLIRTFNSDNITALIRLTAILTERLSVLY